MMRSRFAGRAGWPVAGAGILLASWFLAGCSAVTEEDEHRGPMVHDHDIGDVVHVSTPPYQRLYQFHGHVGPYVVLGFRAGELAREILKSPGYFDMTAEATCPLETPKSCFLDGLQVGSGCTIGKRNLTFSAGEPIRCIFKSKGGKSARISVQEGLPEKIGAWIEESGVEVTGARLLALPRDELFAVELSPSDPPLE